MKYSSFTSAEKSHEHSMNILNLLMEYDDFMASIKTVADLGCGKEALDSLWWANAQTRDDEPRKLKITATGFDQYPELSVKDKNFSYHSCDLNKPLGWKNDKFDIIYCHDVFQYLIDPYAALGHWRDIAKKDSMLLLSVPQTTNVDCNIQEFNMPNGHLYNHTITSMMFMLACAGWDCNSGFLQKKPNDPWINWIVYNSAEPVRDPTQTSWYDLAETELLPKTANASINSYGYPRQQDLILPWLDKSLSWYKYQ